jgi:hypothetical protein
MNIVDPRTFSVGAFPAHKSSKPINNPLWKLSCELAFSEQEPDQVLVMYMDLFYLSSNNERSSLVIAACSLVEILRDTFLREKLLTINQLKTSQTDLLKHVTIGFEKVVGRNLQREQPETYEFLKACWIARGLTAHGKPLRWMYKGAEAEWLNGDPYISLEAIGRIIEWFGTLDRSVH